MKTITSKINWTVQDIKRIQSVHSSNSRIQL